MCAITVRTSCRPSHSTSPRAASVAMPRPCQGVPTTHAISATSACRDGPIVACTVPARCSSSRIRITQFSQLTAGFGRARASGARSARAGPQAVSGAPPMKACSAGSDSTAAISSAWATRSGRRSSRAVVMVSAMTGTARPLPVRPPRPSGTNACVRSWHRNGSARPLRLTRPPLPYSRLDGTPAAHRFGRCLRL